MKGEGTVARRKVFLILFLLFCLSIVGCDIVTEHVAIQGDVKDQRGEGIAGAKISMVRQGIFGAASSLATTDTDGKWTATTKIGTTINVQKKGFEFEPASDKVTKNRVNFLFIGTSTDEGEEPTEPIQDPYTIGGKVADEDGLPIPSVMITIETVDGKQHTAITDRQGEYTKDRISGPVVVSAVKPGYSFSGPVCIERADPNVDFVGTKLSPETYAINGRILDQVGLPIPSVTVKIKLENEQILTAITGSDGTYSKNGLSGTATVTPSKEGYSFTDPITVNGPEDAVDFVGTPIQAYNIKGKVQDNTGEPIENAVIHISRASNSEPDHSPGQVIRTLYSDENGEFSDSNFSGKIIVTISKAGWRFTPESYVIEQEHTAVNFLGTPDVEETYHISGRVLISGGDNDGLGLKAVLLTFEFLDFERETAFATTTDGGTWTKDGLIGRVKIIPSKQGYTFQPLEQIVKMQLETVDFIAIPD